MRAIFVNPVDTADRVGCYRFWSGVQQRQNGTRMWSTWVRRLESEAEEGSESLLPLVLNADCGPLSVEIGWQEGRMLIEEDIESTSQSRR